MLIDIGCGNNKFHPAAIGLDKYKLKGVDIQWDLIKKPYPLKDVSADIIHCSQVLEHLSYSQQATLLSECRRILKKGGILEIHVPHAFSIAAHQDPTHTAYFTFLSIEHYLGNFNEWYVFQMPEYKLVAMDVDVFCTLRRNMQVFWWLVNVCCKILLRLLLRISPVLADLTVKSLPFFAVDIIWILRKNK
ncbi:hypothetical protein A2714_03170 [Candidatus Woesebacteria bacterium RIFCSPHIGHO2_01_FULL_38_9]|uniref:Methyltransferase type 11 domain-containing protein n=1 Tax=Candidatus Woesebacteria bacterium RIFCSPHIGHO2_01_FULL_38_9 TaxID=1802492 RepID=A0A1F7Y1J4_9BACT|nr:MAG: hypothetical protein A2714_03170 [Candidatus Woesebacteria bacterium RIFCSPHIGHO2_01_FULL_38_9]